jgi:predicted transcriptional regulator
MEKSIIEQIDKLLKLIQDTNYPEITGYKVSKETGVTAVVISRLNTGKSKIENISLSTALALYNYMEELEKDQSI